MAMSGAEKINYTENRKPYIEGEEWRDIEEYKGAYQVSNFGRVRSLTRKVWNYTKPGRILKQGDNGHSYKFVSISYEGKVHKHVYVHILVAKAFLDNPNGYEEVNHKDFDKSNNTVDNLEWVSRTQNRIHYRQSQFCRGIEQKRRKEFQSKTIRRIKDNKDQIINQYKSGYTVAEIASQTGLGKDFIADVLALFDVVGFKEEA